MAKATSKPVPERTMPAKGGTSRRQAAPGEFQSNPSAEPAATPAEEK